MQHTQATMPINSRIHVGISTIAKNGIPPVKENVQANVICDPLPP